MSRLERLGADEQRAILGLAALAAQEHRRTRERPALEFASPEHEAFYHSRAPEIVASGWMGSGKSRVLAQKAWDLAIEYPGAEIGLFRKTATSLAATTERTFWQDVVDPRLVLERNRTEHWVDVGTPTARSRIWILGLDADPVTGVPSKVGSLNLDWAGVDEAVELSEGDWIMLGGRLRRTAMPFRQLAAATNPAAPTHWLKRRFTPPTPRREWIAISANRFLPEDYRERLAELGDSVHAKRLAQGLWVSAEGQIWTLADWQIQAMPGPFKRVVMGIDWGFVHAFAAEVVGQSGSGRLSVLAELYVRGAGIDQLAEPLARLAEQHAVADVRADPSEPGLMAELNRGFARHRSEHGPGCGLRASVRPATNDVILGLDAVSRAIRGGLTVDPTCVGLLGELPGYTWKPNRAGGFQERPVDEGDDACDALRYAVMALEPDPKDPWAALAAAGVRVGGVA